jgi:hypothetical protein
MKTRFSTNNLAVPCTLIGVIGVIRGFHNGLKTVTKSASELSVEKYC